MVSLIRKIILILAFFTSPLVNAVVIIDHGDHLTDTVTGLDWLDVTKSANMSYNYVSGQFGIGGLFEGWRYASGAEVNKLISDYTGISNTRAGMTPQETDKIDGLVTLLGSTLDIQSFHLYGMSYNDRIGPDGGTWFYTRGFIQDVKAGTNDHYSSMIDDDDRSPFFGSTPDTSTIYYFSHSNDYASYSIGSFLVRSTIYNKTSQCPIGFYCKPVQTFYEDSPPLTFDEVISIPEPQSIALVFIALFLLVAQRASANRH